MLRLLPRRVESDEYEEAEEPPKAFQSRQECHACHERLTYTDEIYQLEVVEAARENGQIECQPLLCDDGDYQFTPLLVHLECWETIVEQIQESRQDDPPVESPTGILICSCCESTIGSFEPFVSSTFGEIHVSQRGPSGQPAETICHLASRRPVCLSCMVYVIEDYFDEWEDLFHEFNITYEEDDQ